MVFIFKKGEIKMDRKKAREKINILQGAIKLADQFGDQGAVERFERQIREIEETVEREINIDLMDAEEDKRADYKRMFFEW